MTASTKKYFLAALVLCLYPAIGKAVCLSLDPVEPILIAREPGEIVLEYALLQYHHYYPTSCDVKFLDVALAPFYSFFWVGDADLEFEAIGTLIQAQFNMGDLWIRANTLAGRLQQRLEPPKDLTPDQRAAFDNHERTIWGADDILIKLGYDFFYNGDDHTGIYLLGGIPTQRGPIAELDESGIIILKEPVFTLGNFRIGAGINGAWTVYDCNDQHATIHCDLQYRYAFRSSLATLGNFEKKHNNISHENIKSDLCFTPGHFVAAWLAGHYAWNGCQVEAGMVLSGGFGEETEVVTRTPVGTSTEPKKSPKNNTNFYDNQRNLLTSNDFQLIEFPQPRIVQFQFQPYIAAGYSSICWDTPYTTGLGISFDIDKLSQKRKHNFLYGVTAWCTLTMSI